MTEAQGAELIDLLTQISVQLDAVGTLLSWLKLIGEGVAVLLIGLIFCVLAFRRH